MVSIPSCRCQSREQDLFSRAAPCLSDLGYWVGEQPIRWAGTEADVVEIVIVGGDGAEIDQLPGELVHVALKVRVVRLDARPVLHQVTPELAGFTCGTNYSEYRGNTS
jgi:hypothetical protein